MRISFIGIGLMGNAMAGRLLSRGYDLYVYNRTPEKTKALKEKGAKVALTANEAVNLSNVIILMLTDSNAVKEVLFSNPVQDFTSKTIIQMSTILPEESYEISEKVKSIKGTYIEAPVLGSIPQAEEGKLLVLAAGDQELVNTHSEVLGAMGEIHYFGEIKKGAAVKLALNQLIAALTVAFSTSLGIILGEGIDTDRFLEVLRKSSLYAPTYDLKLKNYLSRDFTKANFPVKHLLKDVRLVQTEAGKVGVNTTTIQAIEKILEETIRNGHADADYSALFTTVVSKAAK